MHATSLLYILFSHTLKLLLNRNTDGGIVAIVSICFSNRYAPRRPGPNKQEQRLASFSIVVRILYCSQSQMPVATFISRSADNASTTPSVTFKISHQFLSTRHVKYGASFVRRKLAPCGLWVCTTLLDHMRGARCGSWDRSREGPLVCGESLLPVGYESAPHF